MGLLFNIFPMKQGLFCKISLVQAQILQQKKYGIFFSPRRQAGSGANSRSGLFSIWEKPHAIITGIFFSPLLRSRASARKLRSGLSFLYNSMLAFMAGIFFCQRFPGSARSRYARRVILRICGVRHTVCAGRNTEAPRPTEASKSATARSAPYRR